MPETDHSKKLEKDFERQTLIINLVLILIGLSILYVSFRAVGSFSRRLEQSIAQNCLLVK